MTSTSHDMKSFFFKIEAFVPLTINTWPITYGDVGSDSTIEIAELQFCSFF